MIKWVALWGLLALMLAGCAGEAAGEPAPQALDPQAQPEPARETGENPAPEEKAPPASPTPSMFVQLDDFGPAPELVNEVWLNTDQPLRLADLRGQVVLLDMWTFG